MNDIKVLYEDNHLIAVNKNNNDIVQGDKTGDIPLSEKVKAYIKVKHNKPGDVFIGVVHRIDRPVSGVVLFAKTSKALARLNKMFQEKTIKKTYWAIINEIPPTEEETLEHYIVRKSDKNKSFAHDKEVKNSKLASLTYRLKGNTNKFYLLEIDLHTGRHHQIRTQLQKIGCSIKGDLKYGSQQSNKDGGICLHSRSLKFIHPVKQEEITITAPPPKDILWNEFLIQAK